MDRFGMDRFSMTPQAAFTTTTVAGAERVTAFLRKVYAWMFIGLGLSAVVAVTVASVPGIPQTIASNPLLFWGVWLVPFGLALFMQFRVDRIAPATAAILFFLYSALIGAWLSILFLLYSTASIASVFVITAGMFGAAALFGTVTRRSLAGVGHFFYMGFIGVFLALLVSAFFRSAAENAALQFVISVVGVIVFTGLAAWKANQMKQLALALPDGRIGSYAIVGALQLYITFLNLFLMLLRLLGGSRRS